MKVISYSLFGDPMSFEYPFYLRGLYYNLRMNQILYPDWTSVLHVNKYNQNTSRFENIVPELGEMFDLQVWEREYAPRCEAMLWRILPIFETDAEYVLCRDTDSVSTYREANCVKQWINTGMPYHGINDNDAHSGLMGGLVGFGSKSFKRDTGYTSFEQMIAGQDLKLHGSDQNFMNKYIHPKIKSGLFFHRLKGAGCECSMVQTDVPNLLDRKLWVTDLISRYIGSAGVIDFELLRFLRSRTEQYKYDAFEKKYQDIFYWA